MRVACLLTQKDYAPGDPAPAGYLAWHEWAGVQAKAGLKQVACGRCGLWKFPQELGVVVDACVMKSRKGPVTVSTPVCLICEKGSHGAPHD